MIVEIRKVTNGYIVESTEKNITTERCFNNWVDVVAFLETFFRETKQP